METRWLGSWLAVAASVVLVSCPLTSFADDLKFDDWSGTCNGKDLCFVQLNGAGPRLLAGWNKTENEIRVGALVPVTVGTGQQVTVWVDQNVSIFLQTNSCTTTYCEAMVEGAQTEKVLDLMKASRIGVVAYPEGGKLRVSELSFKGFPEALAAVVAGSPKEKKGKSRK